MAWVYPRAKKWDMGITINGFLGGLVAITAPCYWVNSVRGGDHRPRSAASSSSSASTASNTSASTTRSVRSPCTASPASGARGPSACSPPAQYRRRRPVLGWRRGTAVGADLGNAVVGVTAFVVGLGRHGGSRRPTSCGYPKKESSKESTSTSTVPPPTTLRRRTGNRGRIMIEIITAIIKPHKLDDIRVALLSQRCRGHDDHRGARLRPPARQDRGVPRLGVHRRLHPQDEGRSRRADGNRGTDRAKRSPTRRRPARSATARSGGSTSAGCMRVRTGEQGTDAL